MSRFRISLIRASGLALVLLAGLTACGASGGSATGTAYTRPADATQLNTFEAKVAKGFAASTAEQTQKPPTEGPKGVPGKRIFIVACPLAAEGCKRMSEATKEAAQVLGWDATIIDGKGDPSVGTAAIDRAVAAGANGVVGIALDAVTVAGALTNAKSKGLFSVCAFCGNSDGETGLYDAILPSVQSFANDGYNLGQALYTVGKGHVQQLMLTDPEFVDVVKRQEGNENFMKECEAAGGDCKIVARQQFLVSELATNVPTKVAAAVRQHPNFNILWAPYDDALVFALQGLQQAGLSGGDRWGAGFDANTPSVDRIRSGGDEKASVGLPGIWIGYALVDQLNRLFAGQRPVEQNVKTKVLVQANVPSSGPWDGDIDVRPLYKKLWGIG